MAYIRSKVIKGHTYYYLVRGERHGDKVRQKVIKYLGKNPPEAYVRTYGLPGKGLRERGAESDDTVEFAPILNTKGKEAREFLIQWAQQLGARDIKWDPTLWRESGINGAYCRKERTIFYDASNGNPQLYTVAHEIGHLIDHHVLEWASRSDQFAELEGELNAFTEYRLSLAGSGGARPTLNNLRRYYEKTGNEWTQIKIGEKIQLIKLRIESYFRSRPEQFADLFACCVLEPRKTKAQAPKSYTYMTRLCQAHPELAKFLEALNTHRDMDT